MNKKAEQRTHHRRPRNRTRSDPNTKSEHKVRTGSDSNAGQNTEHEQAFPNTWTLFRHSPACVRLGSITFVWLLRRLATFIAVLIDHAHKHNTRWCSVLWICFSFVYICRGLCALLRAICFPTHGIFWLPHCYRHSNLICLWLQLLKSMFLLKSCLNYSNSS